MMYSKIKTRISHVLGLDEFLDKDSQAEHQSQRVLLNTFLIALLIFIAWAALSDIDQVSRAPGTVIVNSRSQVIQTYDGGILKELLVKPGDAVNEGQILAKLDTSKVGAAFEEANIRRIALKLNVARLRHEVTGMPIEEVEEAKQYPAIAANQRQLLTKRETALRSELASFEKMLQLNQEELRMTEPLVATGDVSRAEVLRLQKQVLELQAQIINRKNRYLQDAQAELSTAQEDLARTEKLWMQRKFDVAQTELRSPHTGVIKSIRVTTMGGVLRPGDELMQVVPSEDEHIIEAKVKPSDIGFIKQGLPVTIKVDAYDYTIYGVLKGRVVLVSPDTLIEETRGGPNEYFRVQVSVNSKNFSGNSNKLLEIQPGMSTTIEVKTGSHSVLSYLVKPVIKTLSESMGER
jgi:adhesin transport system membrane fusion protein